MNKKIWIATIVIALIAAGWFFFRVDTANGPSLGDVNEEHNESDANGNEQEVSGTNGVGDTVADDGEESSDNTVLSFTGTGYEPANVEISVGDTITFRNDSAGEMWPASAMHPTHTVYPGSSIGKCGTEEAESIFDACGAVAPGESWSFTFNEVGEWGYHDHLRVSAFGRITVVEG